MCLHVTNNLDFWTGGISLVKTKGEITEVQ